VKSINILPVKPFMEACRKVHDSGKIISKTFKVTYKCIESQAMEVLTTWLWVE
jgi:hypothetical protein